MRKTAIITMLVLVAASAFALDNFTYSSTSFAFKPMNVRSKAMGGADLVAPSKMEAFYGNPAALANSKFGLEIPSLTITAYNILPLLSDESIDWENIQEPENLTALGTAIINNLGRGRNEILTMDTSVGIKVWHIGLATDVHVGFHALRETNQTADQKVIPEVDVAQTAALALTVLNTNSLKLDVGVAGHFVYKTYLQAQDANSIITKMQGEDADFSDYLTKVPVMSGHAMPFDVGATLTLAKSLKVSATVNNINGNYKMKAYGSFYGMAEKNGVKIEEEVEYDKTVAEEDIIIKIPATVNLGVAFDPEIAFLDPVIELDFVDVFGYAKGFKDFKMSDALKHVNVGAELHLSPLVALRAGMNTGNLCFGAQLNVGILQVDAAYGWMEMGDDWGDKRVDFASIRINIGNDR